MLPQQVLLFYSVFTAVAGYDKTGNQSPCLCHPKWRLVKTRIFGIIESFSCQHNMTAHGSFYNKNCTNLSTVKQYKQIFRSPSTSRDISQELQHSPWLNKCKEKGAIFEHTFSRQKHNGSQWNIYVLYPQIHVKIWIKFH